MSEGRGWFRCAVVGVAGLLGAQGGVALLAAAPVGDIVDRIFGHLDQRAQARVRTLCGCIDEAMASLARGCDPGTIESARRTTEELLAQFGLGDVEFTRLDLNPAAAADAVLAGATFSRDEHVELRPLCRELLICFYRSLPENPKLLAEFLPHLHHATLARLTQLQKSQDRLQATQDTHSRQLDAILASVSEQAGIPLATLRSILEGFGEQIAELDAFTIESKLRTKADDYRELTARLQRLTNADPRVQALRGEAKALLDRGDFAAADARLAEARDLSLAAAAEARQHYASLLETAAESEAERAQAASLRSDHKMAAAHWAEAARIVAPLGEDAGWRYRLRQASALSDHGRERGDNDSLREAVARYRDLLVHVTRATCGDDWAMAQNNLGNALLALGERESGPAWLEEAVAAYRAALDERTRERIPLAWATTQSNLGNALRTLGSLKSDPVQLEEAIGSYQAALQERVRERVPLDWAMTQNNLGTALATLGEQESGTARLQEAVAAYRAALEERTRERVPLAWAKTQSNLGVALATIGERESGTARLEEAVGAFQAALEVYCRELTPLDWAFSQHGLACTLELLAGSSGDPAILEKAVVGIRRAAEIYSDSGVALWQAEAEKAAARIEEKLAGITMDAPSGSADNVAD